MDNIRDGMYYDQMHTHTSSYHACLLFILPLNYPVPSLAAIESQIPQLSTAKAYDIFPAETSVDELFIFQRKEEVLQYLSEHLFVKSILPEVASKLGDYFDNESLVLEVITDPEDEQNQHLAIFIRTQLSPDEALCRLDRFDEDWWLDSVLHFGDALSINLEM